MLKRKSIGIKLTQERLKYFFKDYKNPYTLDFIDLIKKNGEAKGTEVIISLPLK